MATCCTNWLKAGALAILLVVLLWQFEYTNDLVVGAIWPRQLLNSSDSYGGGTEITYETANDGAEDLDDPEINWTMLVQDRLTQMQETCQLLSDKELVKDHPTYFGMIFL